MIDSDLIAFLKAVEIRATDDDAPAPRTAADHFIASAVLAFDGWRAARRDRDAMVRELTNARRKAREADCATVPASLSPSPRRSPHHP